MKDEHQVRIEALKLTQMVGGLSSQASRIKIAAEFEQYILNGYGEAAPMPKASDAVPVTESKAAPGKRTKRASEVPASSGEASEIETEGATDPSELGRPSSRVAGVSV
jgi:hypothetical protein